MKMFTNTLIRVVSYNIIMVSVQRRSAILYYIGEKDMILIDKMIASSKNYDWITA